MSPWLLLAYLIGALFGLFALHRLALALERKGCLYYREKRPSGGVSRAFLGLEEMIEPASRYVHHVADEQRSVTEEKAPGAAPLPEESARSHEANQD
jgi:hypothetical protein